MKYISLNHNSQPVNFQTALINGLAPDKGLYFPEKIINLPKKIIENIKTIDDTELCYEVIKDYIGNDFTEDELIKIIQKTIDFKIPLKKVENSIFSLELFHGPTLAFKDIGAKFLALCMDKIKNDFDSKEITVLVATSGDTGGAVAKGFEGLNGINVCILYPKGRISQVQEKQITTNAKNVIAFEVNGNFDDCQKMVKDAFSDIEIKNKIILTSANSINIARWLPQMFYYFLAIKKIENNNQNIFSVPSGNFGNICAGILSKEMGLNIQLFIASTNINKTVPRYLESGIYNPKKTKPTISNAMDVSNPSNFIRIQKIFNNDLQKINKVIKGYSYNDSETREAIKDVYNSYNYIMDPHSAIGYLGLKSYLKNPRSDVNGIFLSTAHPIKFKEEVENSIGEQISLPSRLKKIMTKKKNTIEIEGYDQLKDNLLRRVN